MNFRVNLAVACAAALSFACADKQAAIPELEEAMQAPKGARVLGLYKMTVTPVETAAGIQAAFEVIPVGQDGNPNTNPINTVQVSGTFGAVTATGPGGCSGVNAITAAVRITNFTIDPLRNVWADVIDMSGNTANTSCNSSLSSTSETFFAVSDMSQGIWKFADLGAAPGDGSAGGTSLPISTGGVWGFRYVTLTPFQFYFRIVADDFSPDLVDAPAAGPTTPLTWTSRASADTQVEICSALPGPAKGSPCPVGLSINQAVAGTGAGPWNYSFAPTGLNPGATYYWRARNVYAAGASSFESDWALFAFNGSSPTVANVTWAANAPADILFLPELSWTTIDAQQDTYAVLCAGTCPATSPDPSILFEGFVPWDTLFYGDGLSHYNLDVSTLILTDLDTGTYFDPAFGYQLLVFNSDGITAPALTDAHSTASVTITPVAIAPTVQTQPASFLLSAGTWPVTWTADPVFNVVGGTVVDVCLPNCADPLAEFYAAGVPVDPAAGVFSLDLYTVLVSGPLVAAPAVAGDAFELVISNSDLYGVFGTSVTGTVAP